MKIKISVIIPVYNMEAYLQECLDTVLSQTLQEIEVICINDGSQDSSEEIIKRNIEKDPRVKLISQENRGVAYARNAGIRSATGEFVIFMDPDDWYPDSDVLKCLYQKAKEENVLICGGSFSEMQPGGLVTEFTGAKKKYAFEKDGILDYKDYQFDYGYHRFIYDLDFLKNNEIYFPPYIRYQDPPFFVKAMICAGKFYAMKKITYRYRVGHQNINWTEKRLNDLLRGLRDNLRMSGDAGLGELHGLTIERLGKSYINMYARVLKDASPELFRLLFEIDSFINRDLIVDNAVAMKYANASCDIIKRAIVIESQKSETEIKKQKEKINGLEKKVNSLKKKMQNMEMKYEDIKNSRSFRCGRVITYIPRKLRDISK